MNKVQPNDELLTPEQTCQLLGGIGLSTLRDWNNHHKHRKLLAPIRYTSKCIRYERKNVIAFMEKCRSVV